MHQLNCLHMCQITSRTEHHHNTTEKHMIMDIHIVPFSSMDTSVLKLEINKLEFFVKLILKIRQR